MPVAVSYRFFYIAGSRPQSQVVPGQDRTTRGASWTVSEEGTYTVTVTVSTPDGSWSDTSWYDFHVYSHLDNPAPVRIRGDRTFRLPGRIRVLSPKPQMTYDVRPGGDCCTGHRRRRLPDGLYEHTVTFSRRAPTGRQKLYIWLWYERIAYADEKVVRLRILPPRRR